MRAATTPCPCGMGCPMCRGQRIPVEDLAAEHDGLLAEIEEAINNWQIAQSHRAHIDSKIRDVMQTLTDLRQCRDAAVDAATSSLSALSPDAQEILMDRGVVEWAGESYLVYDTNEVLSLKPCDPLVFRKP